MKRLARVLLAIVVLLPSAVALGSARPVQACSCVPDLEPGDPIWTAVFSGRASSRPDSPAASEPAHVVSFEVSSVWRGSITDRQLVVTAASSAACGYTFSAGEEYIVHGTIGPGGSIQVNSCSPTTPRNDILARRLDDLIGPHYSPVASAQESEEDDASGLQSDWPRLALAGAIAVALGVATVFVARRH